MYNTEKQATTRASKIAFEECFMSIDSPDKSFDPSIGYRFPYPAQWLSNPSAKKMIGIRSLNVTPSSHVMAFQIILEDYEATSNYSFECSVTQGATLENVMGAISNSVIDYEITGTMHHFKFIYNYDPATSKLIMSIIESYEDGSPSVARKFKIKDPYSNDNSNIEFFARFLNQPDPTATIALLTTYSSIFTFTGVWDRDLLFFHTSFSKSHRNMIGRNKDFWPSPSKKYVFTDNTNDFYVYFTTNGVHRIFPYYCNFYLELTFILNYEHSIV